MNYNVININPEILGGTSVFTGTRVPIQALFDYVEGGESLDEFIENFPTVTHEQAVKVLELAGKLPSDVVDDLQRNITQSRSEWDEKRKLNV